MLGSNVINTMQSMRKQGTLARAIQRARVAANGFPKVPKLWSELIIPDNLKQTSDNCPFLQFEGQIEVGREEKFLIFMSPTGKEILSSSTEWFADGTFDCCSNTLFTQLFVVFAKSRTGRVVPSLFSLLPNKECKSYEQVFSFLKDQGISGPDTFHADFERAIYKVGT